MLNLHLPPLEKDAKPSFTDAASCARWISQFHLTDIRRAHQNLADELDELNRFDLPAIDRLKITEQLRDSVSLAQGGLAKRIYGKPLPLPDADLELFRAIVGLWARMCTSYSRALLACVEGDEGVSRHHALLCQRCLRYTSYQIVEYLLANYEIDQILWRNLHDFYLHAEENEFAATPVLDSLKLYPPPTSCADHYIRTLLTYQANPFELTRKQLQMMNRWLDEWVSWVSVVAEYPANAKEVPPLMVKLDSEKGPAPGKKISDDPFIRYLNVSELSKNLRIKTILLQQGQPAELLGLGEECVQPLCQSFIEHLLAHWCEGRESREFDKRRVNNVGSLCFGMAALHYQLCGRVFQQPRRSGSGGLDISLQHQTEIYTFGHVVSNDPATETPAPPDPGFVIEEWDIQDESNQGFTLFREHGQVEQRLSPGYLVGVKPANSENYMPCMIRWIIVGQGGDVNLGLRLLAGIPEPVAMRATGVNLTVSGKYVQAIVLNPPENSKMQESVIMPSGWFIPKRVIEVQGDDGVTRLLKLETLVGKGADYERARFTPV